MRFSPLTLLTLPVALAATIKGTLTSNSIFNVSSLPPSAKVVLDHGAASTFVRADGSFELTTTEGRHVLDTEVPGFAFPTYIVTILPSSSSEDAQPHVQLHHPARHPYPLDAPSLPYPLVVRAGAVDDYYMPAPGLNVLGLLKSPMVLLMLGSAVMMYFMPKMMANMQADPEMAREMAETRKKMQGMQGDWAASLSGMLAGASAPEDTARAALAQQPAPVARPQKASTPRGRGKGRR
ncbi:hypothetical protein Q5752_005582 [Cryptotrichosporon argae]